MSKELLDVLGLREQYQQGRDLLGSLNKIETEASGLLSHLYDEVRSGLWRDKGMLNAVRQEQQQHALRRKDVAAFIAAHDDKHELPLAIWPSKRADASLPSGENMLQLLEFFDKAIESSDPEDPRPAFWTTSLLREAKLHLYDLLADDMRQQARVAWEPVIDTLRGKLVNRKNDVLPLALRDWRVEIYGQLLDMRYQLGDLDAFEAIYDEFRGLYRFADQEEIVLSDGFASTYHAFIQRNKGASPLFPWFVSMLRFPKQYVRLFVLLLQQIITVKSLRHNSCDYDLMYLQQLHADMHARWRKIGVEAVSLTGAELSLDKATPSAPASILPTPEIIGFKLPPIDELEQLRDVLSQVLAAVDDRHSWGRRRAAVLGFWHAFLLRHTLDLNGCRAALEQLPVGSEALCVLSQSLHGELAYFAGDYEDAQLHFRRAQALAERLLRRYQRIYTPDPETITPARAFLGRLCQWRGNAFVFLGDYALASDTTTRSTSTCTMPRPRLS